MKVKELSKKTANRVDVKYLRSLDVQGYGEDNLYPQTIRNLLGASSTGSECVERYRWFIEGNGFRADSLAEYVVNRRGDTADDIHKALCNDMAVFDGLAIHVNYNILGQIVEMNHVPFENCRLQEEDDNGYVAKIAVHADWSGKKTRNGKVVKVDRNTVDMIDVFNPIKEVIAAQIEAAGGIEFYKGQILWISGAGRNTYPVPKADRVSTELSTDEGLANVKYRNVRCNFLPAAMVITKKGQSSPAYDDDGNEIHDEDSGFSDSLVQLQGDTNASKLIEVEIGADEEKPEVVQLRANNYDKEFTVTEASTVERIYSAFSQEPWYCIRIGKIGFGGDILEDAFEYYNSIVGSQQRTIERAFKRIFSFWCEKVNISDDYSVEPLKYVRNATYNNPE